MKVSLKLILQIVLVIVSILLIFFHYRTNVKMYYTLYILLYFLVLAYHFFMDSKKNFHFIIVISFFLLASILGAVNVFLENKHDAFIYLSYTLSFIAYILLFVEMVKENRNEWEINKNALLVPFIIGITVFLSTEIVGLITEYNLHDIHLWYIFLFTILKLAFLSLGIIFYLLSKNNYRNVSLLNWAISFYLFRDIIETVTYLYFMYKPIGILLVLDDITLFFGLIFFYLYCTSPKKLKALEIDTIE